MNNKNLEALAELASADSSSSQQDENREMKGAQEPNSRSGNADATAAASSTSNLDGKTVPPIASIQTAGDPIPQTDGSQPSAGAGIAPDTLQQMLQNFKTPSTLAMLQALQQQQQKQQQRQQQQNESMIAMQQLAYYQYLFQANAAAGQAGPSTNQLPQTSVPVPNNNAMQSLSLEASTVSSPQVLPTIHSDGSTQLSTASPISTQSATNMPPPTTTVPLLSPSSPSASKQQSSIAPQPSLSSGRSLSTGGSLDSSNESQHSLYDVHVKDKKQQKRAANRRSAQLSRKRKKQFIEELKDENDDLRRKEHILRSIPDLVVVFDSSGKLWFVSESVSRFLDFSSTELEGTSFWNRLCEDSVRLLKAAFMDSLAARQADSDTAPLGNGYWELRLVDKDGSHKIITLNGVVHFAGQRPECVCSVRPRRQDLAGPQALKKSSNSLMTTHMGSAYIPVAPQQSVIGSLENSEEDACSALKKHNHASARKKGSDAVRISDSGNSSGNSSESGRSDD